ncbi:MAG: hypothetical protein HRF40_06965 [Nitrososphaera sp.]
MPDNIGRSDGCIKTIHTDDIGNQIHIEYQRPTRLTMEDFIKVYLSTTGSDDDDAVMTVVDNSTGIPRMEAVQLEGYEISYYYRNASVYPSSEPERVSLEEFPPFMDYFVGRIELKSK